MFEKESKLGGVLRYGAPDFRLPKELVDELENKVKELGISIKTNVELGKDFTIESLKEEYTAIFLGVGATKSTTYNLGETSSQVFKADEFLKKYNTEEMKLNGTTIVIGGRKCSNGCCKNSQTSRL